MVDEVILNDYKIKAINFKKEIVQDQATGKSLNLVHFDFKVKGGDEYHDITVLLYKEVFEVNVPAILLKFKGTIHHYSTSIPNFDDEHAVVDFKLGLIEIKKQAISRPVSQPNFHTES